jgi:hypothetical protein
MRDDAIKACLEYAERDRANGCLVLLGGDFNEPSHLDWTESTKNDFDHHGLVIPWTVSQLLTDKGYKDVYREVYPNPVTHPGITFPANTPNVPVKKLTWAPEADERERIDFIYYAPHPKLKLINAFVWGPDSSISRSSVVGNEAQDLIRIGEGVWPTDHKAVLAIFELK